MIITLLGTNGWFDTETGQTMCTLIRTRDYSVILDAGYATASAVSFLHNVLRELLAIILIPTIADHVGYAETVALPGAAAMDVCLPIVERATNSNVAVYSFVSGVVLSFAVPILVPLIVG